MLEVQPEILPLRLLAQYVYCPRLAHLTRAGGEWEDNEFVEEGRGVHARVNQGQDQATALPTRAVALESPRLGIRGVVDVLERQGGSARPVEYKRGKKPANPEQSYEPERVQLCAQGLLLRERGLRVSEGVLFYAASRHRLRVRFTPQLEARVFEVIRSLREVLAKPLPPPPLVDSPKCIHCSLVKICLPEETNFLTRGGTVRPLAVAEAQRHPLVVQRPGTTVGLDGERLVLRDRGRVIDQAGLETLSQVVLMGTVGVSTAALHACLSRAIPVVFLSGSGWFYGYARGLGHKNCTLRARQYEVAGMPAIRQTIVNTLISNKIANSRTLLRRNGHPPSSVLARLGELVHAADAATSTEELLSVEGQGARLYFEHFSTMFKQKGLTFSFENRTRRPPTDPVNALLSLLSTLLVKDWTLVLETVGFDPYMGLYHAPRHGKPALALDLMEPFRPVVAESVVVTLLNNGEVSEGDFLQREEAWLLTPDARRVVVAGYQRRLAAQVTHPLFGYRVSYRRLFEIHARLLARYLLGELAAPPKFTVR